MSYKVDDLQLRDGTIIFPRIILDCIADNTITMEKLTTTLQNTINSKANASDVYTKTETYSKTEVNNALSYKADVSDVYTKTYIDTLMQSYYTQTDVNDLLSLYYNKAYIDNLMTNYYTASEINSIFNNYYNKTAVDNLLNNKANSSDVYTKTYIDTLISSYYSKTEVDTLLSSKIDTSDQAYTWANTMKSYMTIDGGYVKYGGGVKILGEFWANNSTVYLYHPNNVTFTALTKNLSVLLNEKQDALTTTSVSSGTITDAIGFDTNGNIVKGSVGSKVYTHHVTFKCVGQTALFILAYADFALPTNNVLTLADLKTLFEDNNITQQNPLNVPVTYLDRAGDNHLYSTTESYIYYDSNTDNLVFSYAFVTISATLVGSSIAFNYSTERKMYNIQSNRIVDVVTE